MWGTSEDGEKGGRRWFIEILKYLVLLSPCNTNARRLASKTAESSQRRTGLAHRTWAGDVFALDTMQGAVTPGFSDPGCGNPGIYVESGVPTAWSAWGSWVVAGALLA